jgi:hypothetical protein
LQPGRAVEWPDSPERAQLDRVPNPQALSGNQKHGLAVDPENCFGSRAEGSVALP